MLQCSIVVLGAVMLRRPVPSGVGRLAPILHPGLFS
jgi:hypothetical protein